MKAPQTLQEAIVYFADPANCLAYMVVHRWPDGVTCPTCGRKDTVYLAKQKKWQCKSVHTKRQFSAKIGTIFEDSPLGLDKWLPAVWLITSAKNGISSCEIARSLGVTQKSAWFMLHRIRLAMRNIVIDGKLGGPDGGEVEVDESFVGGEPKNWHKDRRERRRKEVRTQRVREYQNAFTHKTAVLGMFDRESRQVRAKVVPNVRRETLQKETEVCTLRKGASLDVSTLS